MLILYVIIIYIIVILFDYRKNTPIFGFINIFGPTEYSIRVVVDKNDLDSVYYKVYWNHYSLLTKKIFTSDTLYTYSYNNNGLDTNYTSNIYNHFISRDEAVYAIININNKMQYENYIINEE